VSHPVSSGPDDSCPDCGAATGAAVGRAAMWTDRGIVVVEDIPTRLCEACGEQSWAADVAARVEQLLAGSCQAPAAAEALIPVFSFRPDSDRPPPDSTPPAFADEDEACVSSPDDPTAAGLCKYCGAATQPQVVRTVLSGERWWIAVEGIPARVCPACGERFYDEQTTWQLATWTASGPPADAAQPQIPCRIVSFATAE